MKNTLQDEHLEPVPSLSVLESSLYTYKHGYNLNHTIEFTNASFMFLSVSVKCLLQIDSFHHATSN